MSLQFSDTTNNRGIVQTIDDLCGTDSTSYPLKDKTRDINLALDRVLALIFEVGGTWQFDDSNQTDYPIITTNLVSGQRDYSFTLDANSNLILEIFRVMVADPNGVYQEISPSNVGEVDVPPNYYSGQNITGQPSTYQKLGNGILLDPPSNYNRTAGLKIYVNREGSYFTTSDTTKKPGFAGLFHEYLALRPAYMYCLKKQIAKKNDLKNDMIEMENAIMNYYKAREKDNPKVIRPLSNRSR